MKSKKILSIFSILLFCLIFSQRAMSQNSSSAETNDSIDEMLVPADHATAQRTREIMSKTLLSNGSEIVGNDNQLFLINLNQPIGVMKDASNPDKTEFWYVVVSNGGTDDETEQTITAEAEPALPLEFALSQNYPNPFNPSTTIKFQLPDKNGLQPIRTVLKVYDILGRLVRTVVDEELTPGFYTRQWDGLNDSGTRISSGVYFYTITAGEFRATKKMLLLK